MRNLKIITLSVLSIIHILCSGQALTATNNKEFPEAGLINPLRLNHVGFLPEAHKFFVTDHPYDSIFEVFEIKDVEYYKVYEGKLERVESELPGQWLGDFSFINKQGNYMIKCGNKQSRFFSIYDKIYDAPQRILFNFFTWQRCGNRKGWAGECHLEDGIIKETGEHKDFSGGYHQSCDLRKSLDGVAIGITGMIRYALLNEENPHWDEGDIAEEIKWACDYYMKLIHPDGYMYDGLFIPFGWGPRYYYNSPAAISEQWNSIILLAVGSQYFKKNRDDKYAKRCLTSALKIWDFLNSERGPAEAYEPPDAIPRGMSNALTNYYQVYKGSADYIGFKLSAAAELYRASNNLKLLDEVTRCANKLCELQIEKGKDTNPVGACFWESPDSNRIAGSGTSYTALHTELGLCDAIELMPDSHYSQTWEIALKKIIRQYTTVAQRNIWDRTPTKWIMQDDFNNPDYFLYGNYFLNNKYVQSYYTYGRGNLRILYQGIVLSKASRILKQPELMSLAQRQADWVLGANPYDISSVEGVGFNQMSLPMWGQYFPNTPQIPGGVIVGLNANSQKAPHGNGEYDMPITGYLMWMLSELRCSYKK